MLVKYPSYMKTSDMQSPKQSNSWLWLPSIAIYSYFPFEGSGLINAKGIIADRIVFGLKVGSGKAVYGTWLNCT